ncbi:assimilatory sulfite reductase (NADPH) flavoprotein subunit [Blochmannia endosymbiont of Polyrhachis (Hedomyrma) turneri]|uniref:assimilatory sulfite reductase (NADPH) flavoprotein subunit n=1 Tax=Blochmannia endosymbiont of Polyrhachis (Hedomyrma) turneri TaxID=1505596 RepID=UPI00061A54B3|nr:assimilatory sulfite reductase (NADPH) flavoprotein subunit [Blochmannia endosymbiont of Polyrhachis (Hedomyrma) turneri]AKC59742.1 sulfite reductase [NADPH] flavoprotein alpha-component [Blochmannia endosymbiont of Polyrhachis (Hedomyrma) turneri]
MKNIQSNFNVPFAPLNKEQWDIFQKLITTLSMSQKIWMSGYLCGMSVSCTQSVMNIVDCNQQIFGDSSFSRGITILSASQTGNARKLAGELYQSLLNEGFNVNLFNVGDYNIKKIAQEKLFFLITSTYGEGEPPEEAVMLYKYLFSKNAPNMKDVYFSVFGIGDSSYLYFSKAAKDFDKRLEELGACRIYERIDADVDYYQKACDWRCKIIDILKKQFMVFYEKTSMLNSLNNSENLVNINRNSFEYSNVYTRESPFSASLILRQKITSRDSLKDVYHLEINLSGSGLCYQPGDALGVWYENDPDLVGELLGYCHFTGNEEVNIQDNILPCNLALQKYCELTNNTPLFAKSYARLISNQKLLSEFSDENNFKKFISSTSIVDMIRFWPPRGLIPRELVSLFRPLVPRLYSISSSQDEVGEEAHITVGMVRYKCDNFIRTGGASGYLVDRLLEGGELRVFIVPNENFRLPVDHSKSIIMVAAGTGVAPFRAFVQQRSSDSSSGKNWLFFGNLNFLNDFLYQREWQRYVKDGILTNVHTAWSRDQNCKIYVQDKILEYGLEVWQWIKSGAYIYVCGDASRMAHGVEESLIQLAVKYGNMSIEESDLFWGNMRIDHRYQKDVY